MIMDKDEETFDEEKLTDPEIENSIEEFEEDLPEPQIDIQDEPDNEEAEDGEDFTQQIAPYHLATWREGKFVFRYFGGMAS